MEIGLALGGGGVRGYAHLGVIHVLQQTGYRIRAIAGSSAGAVIGSLFAAGYNLVEIQNKLEGIEIKQSINRKAEDFPSLLGLAGFEKFLRSMLDDRLFSELEIPLAVNAVNLTTGTVRSFREGDVVNSVMASIALPGIFPPRFIDESLYVDGCVVDPVPVRTVRELAPGVPVVAVALSPMLSHWGNYNEKSSLLDVLPVLERFLDRSRVAQSIHTFLKGVDIGSTLITDLSLERDRPEILIRPKVFDVGLLERVNSDNLVTAGEDATFEQLESIRQVLSWRGKLGRLLHR